MSAISMVETTISAVPAATVGMVAMPAGRAAAPMVVTARVVMWARSASAQPAISAVAPSSRSMAVMGLEGLAAQLGGRAEPAGMAAAPMAQVAQASAAPDSAAASGTSPSMQAAT